MGKLSCSEVAVTRAWERVVGEESQRVSRAYRSGASGIAHRWPEGSRALRSTLVAAKLADERLRSRHHAALQTRTARVAGRACAKVLDQLSSGRVSSAEPSPPSCSTGGPRPRTSTRAGIGTDRPSSCSPRAKTQERHGQNTQKPKGWRGTIRCCRSGLRRHRAGDHPGSGVIGSPWLIGGRLSPTPSSATSRSTEDSTAETRAASSVPTGGSSPTGLGAAVTKYYRALEGTDMEGHQSWRTGGAEAGQQACRQVPAADRMQQPLVTAEAARNSPASWARP